ncbi:substrate-binding domain-containing protein, partial [Enterobacter asburiae]
IKTITNLSDTNCLEIQGASLDLSIIGFDNISLSEFCDPPLSTVAQPRYQIGREAMLLLLDQLHGQTVSSGSRLLDCELIVRGTTQALT